MIKISFPKSVQEIPVEKSKEIMVTSFMQAYKDFPFATLDPNFKSIEDVRHFYEHYFASDLALFEKGTYIWAQAFLDTELAGWATFELEGKDTLYMNSLVVSPDKQKRGIGKELIFSLRSKEIFSQITTVQVLLRKINTEALKFYEKLGFIPFSYNRKDNLIDPSLLTGLKLVFS